MRMPLARLLTTRLPTEWPKRVKTVDYVESAEIDGVLTHHVAGRTRCRRLPVLDHRRTAPVAAARRPDLRGRTGPAAVLGELLGLEHESTAAGDHVPVHPAGRRTPDRLCRPGIGIRRRPATGRAERGGQAMSSRKCAGPYVACLAAMATLVLLPIGDAIRRPAPARRQRWRILEVGPRGQRQHVATRRRPIRRSRRPVDRAEHSGRHRGDGFVRRAPRQPRREPGPATGQSRREPEPAAGQCRDVRDDREDYYEDRYDDWDGYDDDDHELAAGLVVGAVVGAAAASAGQESTTTSTTTTTAATT